MLNYKQKAAIRAWLKAIEQEGSKEIHIERFQAMYGKSKIVVTAYSGETMRMELPDDGNIETGYYDAKELS